MVERLGLTQMQAGYLLNVIADVKGTKSANTRTEALAGYYLDVVWRTEVWCWLKALPERASTA